MKESLLIKLREILPELPPEGDQLQPWAITTLKTFLAEEEADIFRNHLQITSGWHILKRRSDLIDAVIYHLFDRLYVQFESRNRKPDTLSLLAGGGYGRREMHPCSDIDVIFVYQTMSAPVEEFATTLLHWFWDIGFDLGHAFHSITECLAQASTDLASQTSLMESRLLAGDPKTFNHLKSSMNETLVRKQMDSYIMGKVKEMEHRHQSFGNSLYHLEPNLKNGVGGLRDMQTALWIAQARFGVQGLMALKETGFLSAAEAEESLRHLDFLWKLRNHLHYYTHRKQDILTFACQPAIAENMGFRNDQSGDAVEHMMRAYYRAARHIQDYSWLYIQRCFPPSSRRVSYLNPMNDIAPGIVQKEGTIHIKEFSPVPIDASLIMRCFLECQRRNLPLSHAARTVIRNRVDELPLDCFREPAPLKLFNDMLFERGHLYRALREMHELQVLERFIPEFKGLTCLVRHDLQHRYTVDEHTLRLVMFLQQLKNQTSLERDEDTLPPKELINVYYELNQDRVLMLTALLHDIGKVAKTKHVVEGIKMLPEILHRLELPPEDQDKIITLVTIHHRMSEVAQHHDLDDRRVLHNFAQEIGSLEILKLLYLITYADMRSVSKEVWTPWKAALLSELYHKAAAILTGQPLSIGDDQQHLDEVKETVLSLAQEKITADEVDTHFNGMSPRYLLSTEPHLLLSHLIKIQQLNELQIQNPKIKPILTEIEHKSKLGYSDFTVFTLDQPGLFAQITGTLASKSISIFGAQIFTRKDGVVIDTFVLDHRSPGWTDEETAWDDLQIDLGKVINGEKDIAAILSAQQDFLKSQTPSGDSKTQISISNQVSDTHTVVDIRTRDRIGLLHILTRTLAELGLSIATSRIATYGPRAVDVFYVTDLEGRKIQDEEKVLMMKDKLNSALA